jgi:hypothetical protein
MLETITINTISYDLETISGTGPISVNLDGVPQPTGIPTSSGATVIATSDIPGGNANFGTIL